MEYTEDALPQKLQIPAMFRRSVGNDIQARSFCPINGTGFDGKVEPIQEEKRANYHNRKERERERRANASHCRCKARARGWQAKRSGAMWAQERSTPSSGRTPEPSAPTFSASHGTFHMWSIDSGPSAPSTQIEYQGSTTRLHTNLNHFDASTPPTSDQPEQFIAGTPGYYGPEIELHYPYTGVGAASSRSPALEADNMSTADDLPATPDKDTSHDERSMRSPSPPPPALCMSDFATMAASPSVHTSPSGCKASVSATQGSWWCDDRYFAAHQGFSFPQSSSSRSSSRPASTLAANHHETWDPEDGTFATRLYASSAAPMRTDHTTYHNTAERDACKVPRPSDVDNASQSRGSDYLDWHIPPMVVEPVDPQRLKELEDAVAAGYAHTLYLHASLSSALPEEAYMATHPAPPPVPSTHSELAHAMGHTAYGFAANAAPGYTHSGATAVRRTWQGFSGLQPRPQRALRIQRQLAASRHF